MDGIILKETKNTSIFYTAAVTGRGVVLVNLRWLWTGNCELINFYKKLNFIQSMEMGKLF